MEKAWKFYGNESSIIFFSFIHVPILAIVMVYKGTTIEMRLQVLYTFYLVSKFLKRYGKIFTWAQLKHALHSVRYKDYFKLLPPSMDVEFFYSRIKPKWKLEPIPFVFCKVILITIKWMSFSVKKLTENHLCDQAFGFLGCWTQHLQSRTKEPYQQALQPYIF